jgi:DNA-binding NarL/FixJ family response regulator
MSARVVIVEDHALVRTGLRTTLRTSGFEVVGETGDGLAAGLLIADLKPDVAIVDLGIPGRDGISLTRYVKNELGETRVVVLTMREEEATVQAVLQSGADGYCVKSSPPEIVVDAVRTVAAGGAYFDARVAAVVRRRLGGRPAPGGLSPLTPREAEVLELIAEGTGNAEIALALGVSLATVKTHVAEVLRKLAAVDRAHATAIALRSGYLA